MLNKANDNFFLKSSALFLILFIDGMGLSLIMPILVTLILEPHTSILANGASVAERNFIYGFILAIYFFCWFWGAAIISDWSDQVGRKKALFICLLGTFLGYALSIFAVLTQQIWLLLIGRIIDGFTTGSQPLAQAAIIDLSTEQTRARNIAYITSATSVGFILGPLIGGFLSDPHLVSWFSPTTPLYFMSILSLANVMLLLSLFKETFVSKQQAIKLKWYRAIGIFTTAFKRSHIRHLASVYLIVQVGWAAFYSYILLFLFHRQHFNVNENSIYFTLVGLGFVFSSIFLINPTVKRLGAVKTCIVTAILTASLILISYLARQAIIVWLLAPIIPAIMIIFYATILSLFSSLVSVEQQGWIMGIAESVKAFAFSLSGFICSFLASKNPGWPILLAILAIGLGGAILTKRSYR